MSEEDSLEGTKGEGGNVVVCFGSEGQERYISEIPSVEWMHAMDWSR
jgi:hypothetical protein